ncbi:unnamed protein product [Chrysodeixis includens]|uniref:Uncharacterized protein n=1 Tax=Chrysodeixis includens TaxID=689277 RepID=A0A9N8KXU3_CHRIL|nr:unnamed protein product [Chrysodeixis includens]
MATSDYSTYIRSRSAYTRSRSAFHGRIVCLGYKVAFKSRMKRVYARHLRVVCALSYYINSPLYSVKPNILTRHYDFMDAPANKDHEPTNSWEAINDILKNLSKTGDDAKYGDRNLVELLQGLSKLSPNESANTASPDSAPSSGHILRCHSSHAPCTRIRSVYRGFPRSSQYSSASIAAGSGSFTPHSVTNSVANKPSPSTPRPTTTKYKTDSITWRQPPASYRTNYLEEVDDTLKVQGLPAGVSNTWKSGDNESLINTDGRSGPLLPLALDVDSIILNATIHRPPFLNDNEKTKNLINEASSTPKEVRGTTVTPAMKRRRRKKRYIHVIPIEHAKPHHWPVKIEVPVSTEHSDKIADAQEFQRLIEMQDDEVHDRVALRYLRQYVGPALFNICDFDEAAARHVYLFNSSRLVLAITNFTLERMTVVMTPARTLLTSEARCTNAHLECQVSGARVCIDSLSACDGVPNCGSYDIYDEDRLTCGGSEGLHHNVCLAAITFLAVLLTILYTIHYWLKRCVPKVSDAFFIYTDAAENVLVDFRDSIRLDLLDSHRHIVTL